MKKMLAILLLATAATAAPSTEEVDGKLVITEKFFLERLMLYSGKHDIVEIIVPLNHINYLDDSMELCDETYPETIFFVEADINDKGVKDYKGLYLFKDNKTKLILENGQCATYALKYNVYFGAKDGIYKYNHTDLTATKYGTVTESVIKMALDFSIEHVRVYYLTEDYVLYKYNENEVESSVVEAVKDARDITFDFYGIMYYYDGQNQFYTYNGEKVTKIEGLPAHPTKVALFRVPVLFNDAFAAVDGKLYSMEANGTSEITPVEFQVMPTASAPEPVLYQFYAYKKKLYGFNFATLLSDRSIEELSTFFDDKEEQIKAIWSPKVSTRL